MNRMAIPIQNIYYLLSYAWHLLEEDEDIPVSGIPGESELNLLAYLLQKYTHLLLKKGLAQQYERTTQTISGIKGKLAVIASLQNNALQQGKATCTFETLSMDNLPNQLIKSTIQQVIATPGLNENISTGLRALLPPLKGVRSVSVAPDNLKNVAAQRFLNPYYYPVLSVCALLNQNLLPEAGRDAYRFSSFLEDEKQMGKLFEAFVRNFYTKEQETFRVKSEKISWQLGKAEEDHLQYLPVMVTDVSLTSANRKLILDTKFYKNALRPHYDKQKLISGHLYQLFAYLKNQSVGIENNLVEGILLYPVVNQELDLAYQLSGHKVSIKTINLNQPWPHIKADLLQIIA